MKFKASNNTMTRMPINAIAKRYSATFSSCCSFASFAVLMEKKENRHEKTNNTATNDVNSSTILTTE